MSFATVHAEDYPPAMMVWTDTDTEPVEAPERWFGVTWHWYVCGRRVNMSIPPYYDASRGEMAAVIELLTDHALVRCRPHELTTLFPQQLTLEGQRALYDLEPAYKSGFIAYYVVTDLIALIRQYGLGCAVCDRPLVHEGQTQATRWQQRLLRRGCRDDRPWRFTWAHVLYRLPPDTTCSWPCFVMLFRQAWTQHQEHRAFVRAQALHQALRRLLSRQRRGVLTADERQQFLQIAAGRESQETYNVTIVEELDADAAMRWPAVLDLLAAAGLSEEGE